MKIYELICCMEDIMNLAIKKVLQRKLPIKKLPVLISYKILMGRYKRKFKKTHHEGNQAPHGADLEKALDILYPWIVHYESELKWMKQQLENL